MGRWPSGRGWRNTEPAEPRRGPGSHLTPATDKTETLAGSKASRGSASDQAAGSCLALCQALGRGGQLPSAGQEAPGEAVGLVPESQRWWREGRILKTNVGVDFGAQSWRDGSTAFGEKGYVSRRTASLGQERRHPFVL